MPLFAQIWTDIYSFGMAIVATLVFGAIGIVLAIVGFKLFDKMTPGKLDEEILQKQNVAAAVLAGAFLLGICIIIAAAIHG
jgi:putative membrane protein